MCAGRASRSTQWFPTAFSTLLAAYVFAQLPLAHTKVLLAQLSSRQRDSLGHLQQSLRQCTFPISPVAINVQTPSQVVRWCKHPPVLSCVPMALCFHSTAPVSSPHTQAWPSSPLQDQCQLLMALKQLWGHNTRHLVQEGWGCPALGAEGWWHEGALFGAGDSWIPFLPLLLCGPPVSLWCWDQCQLQQRLRGT